MMAQSTAEAASSEYDLTALAEKIKAMDNVQSAEADASGSTLDIVFDTDGSPAGKDFCAVLHRTEDKRDSGVYTKDNIEVYYCVPGELDGKIYDLSTGRHFTAEEVGS
jgi:hypothetical protein